MILGGVNVLLVWSLRNAGAVNGVCAWVVYFGGQVNVWVNGRS